MVSHGKVVNNILQRLALHSAEARLEESLFQEELAEKDDEAIGEEKDQELYVSPIKREVPSFEAQDPLIEVNLGTTNEPRVTKISGLLSQGERDQLIQLITRYKDCFAWDNMKCLDYLEN